MSFWKMTGAVALGMVIATGTTIVLAPALIKLTQAIWG